MITRRGVLWAGGICVLLAHRLSHGEQAETVRRVGILSTSSDAVADYLYAALKHGMEDLGWLEGKSVEYRIVSANGEADRLGRLADELVEQKVDVILVGNGQTTAAAHRATKTIPIVMTSVGNAVGSGFVASLARPGGNITGVTTQTEAVVGKLIGILHEVTPAAQRIAIVLNEANPAHSAYWVAAQGACSALDLVALRIVASTPTQLGAAVVEIARQRAQAIVVPSDFLYFAERAKLQDMLQSARLPAAYGWREHVVAGGLLSYGPDLAASYRHAATYVDKIFKGAKPKDLPIEQATKFELVINLKTAKALGISIPKDMLLRADEVIQ